jgi:hypothetical protein
MAGKKKNEVINPSPNWGGKREGSGRKTQGEILRLKEILDETMDAEMVMGKLRELIENGDYRAIDLYLKYRVGSPTQSIEVTSTHDINFNLNNIVSFDDIQEIDES